jgi:nitrogen fixation NifU-like protein
MSDLDELYQTIILDHDRSPRNYGRIENATHSAEGYNPLCGDRLFVTLRAGERIDEIKFEAQACSIAKASASLMTLHAPKRTIDDAKQLAAAFEAMVRGSDDPAADLGELVAFAGVRRFPSRIRCATLPWHAMLDALTRSRR